MAVVLDGDEVVAKFHRVTVRFGQGVLKMFDDHRQRGWFKREAGGQLFAKVDGDVWQVINASGPKPQDRRGRFHFWPDRRSEQMDINSQHALGLEYVGDWHTHPEKVPRPSESDLFSIGNVVRESTFLTPGLILCIVGLEAFPEGLHVSYHA
jgi:integrative and conjugative element protein (TIGR02256 family)